MDVGGARCEVDAMPLEIRRRDATNVLSYPRFVHDARKLAAQIQSLGVALLDIVAESAPLLGVDVAPDKPPRVAFLWPGWSVLCYEMASQMLRYGMLAAVIVDKRLFFGELGALDILQDAIERAVDAPDRMQSATDGNKDAARASTIVRVRIPRDVLPETDADGIPIDPDTHFVLAGRIVRPMVLFPLRGGEWNTDYYRLYVHAMSRLNRQCEQAALESAATVSYITTAIGPPPPLPSAEDILSRMDSASHTPSEVFEQGFGRVAHQLREAMPGQADTFRPRSEVAPPIVSIPDGWHVTTHPRHGAPHFKQLVGLLQEARNPDAPEISPELFRLYATHALEFLRLLLGAHRVDARDDAKVDAPRRAVEQKE